MMFTCLACGHDDMVHTNYVGCCGVIGCACEGIDGTKRCHREMHGTDCGWATLRTPTGSPSDDIIHAVLREHHDGVGVVKLHRKYELGKDTVRRIIAGTIAPAGVPAG